MGKRGPLLAALILVAGVLIFPEQAQACAVCFGDPDSPMTEGLNKAILALVGIIGLVQVGILKVIWDIRKRSKNRPLPTELRLVGGGKH